jgi:hypothetical protein
MTSHQQKQIEVIETIEKQVNSDTLNFSTVAPVDDFENDPRICLTSVHFPEHELLVKITDTIISPLKIIEPSYYYYPADSLHMTIKNVKVVNDPPHFTDTDITNAEKIFSDVIPKHKKFNVYFYRLFLFPNNLALFDGKLKDAKIPDDKKYTNAKYFFSNMTLARFEHASDAFKNTVKEISGTVILPPYEIDSVSLVTCNAVFAKRTIIRTWQLK